MMGMNMKTSVAIEKAVPVADPDVVKSEFRNAMARMAAAVSIVTTNGPAGLAGFAATAVCSVSDSPPTLLVCLNRTASVHPAVTENGVLCVNVLSEGHQDLSRLFGGQDAGGGAFCRGRMVGTFDRLAGIGGCACLVRLPHRAPR